jgi:hypothetical protein
MVYRHTCRMCLKYCIQKKARVLVFTKIIQLLLDRITNGKMKTGALLNKESSALELFLLFQKMNLLDFERGKNIHHRSPSLPKWYPCSISWKPIRRQRRRTTDNYCFARSMEDCVILCRGTRTHAEYIFAKDFL